VAQAWLLTTRRLVVAADRTNVTSGPGDREVTGAHPAADIVPADGVMGVEIESVEGMSTDY
jgi:hypothetical protein